MASVVDRLSEALLFFCVGFVRTLKIDGKINIPKRLRGRRVDAIKT